MPTTKKLKVHRKDYVASASHAIKISLKDPKSADYLRKDSQLCVQYGISRHTLYAIRKDQGIPSRSERIVGILKKMNTKKMYLEDVVVAFNNELSYQSLYKIVQKHEIPIMRKNKSD